MVSILILTNEHLELIQPCLESLLETVNQDDIEVVIGDTGSSNPRIFELYDYFGKTFQGITQVIDLEKYHFSTNNNELAERSSGDTLIFLNNDTYAYPGWCGELVNALKQPGVGASGAKLLFSDYRIQHAGIEFLSHPFYGFVGYHPYQHRRHNMPEANIPKYVPAVTAACLAITKKIFGKVGGFDPEYQEEFQDTDLGMKLRKIGLKSAYNPKAVLHHFEGGSRGNCENHADRYRFMERWKDLIKEQFFINRFQSEPIESQARDRLAATQYILVERQGYRSDIFAGTALVKQFKEANPLTHITYKTDHPELVDSLPFIDRAIHFREEDSYRYDKVLRPTYENGEWRFFAHTWLDEMGRTMGVKLDPKTTHPPQYVFSDFDQTTLFFYETLGKKTPYLVFSTWVERRSGRRWPADKWEQLSRLAHEDGYQVLQIGKKEDYWIKDALHLFDLDLHTNLAVVKGATALVTLDSFLLQLGMAVGLPTTLLTCDTSSHTLKLTPDVIEVRNHRCTSTPLPACQQLGCRLKFGYDIENHCETPILEQLSAETAYEYLKPALKRSRPTRKER